MSVYVRVYGHTDDRNASGTASSSYATARVATTASVATTFPAILTGQFFSTPNYSIEQGFLVFDTSSISSGLTSATLSLNCTAARVVAGDSIEVRPVSSTTNAISGDSLAGLTPLFGTVTMPSVTGRFSITLDISGMARASTVNLLLHSLKQRTATAPTGDETTTYSAADTSGTTNDPYLDATTGAWTLVGVGTNVVQGAAANITLTEPAGVAAGDLLVACLAIRTTVAGSNPFSGIPVGWTTVGFQGNNNVLTTGSAIASGAMFYHVRGASAPSLVFTMGGSWSVGMGQIVAYRGVDTTAPADFFPAIVPTSDAHGDSGTNATYSVVREATTATTSAPTTGKTVGHSFSGGLYQVRQYFLTLNTSSIPSTATSAVLSVNATTGSAGSTIEVREVTSSANLIAGSALDAAGPLLGSFVTTGSSGRINISLNITSMTRGSAVILCLYAQNQRLNVAPTTTSVQILSTLAATADLRPYLASAAMTAVTAAAGTAVSVAGLTTTQDDDLIVAMAAGGQEAAWSAFTNATTPLTASGATDTTTAPSTTAWIERADSVTTTGADTSLGIFDAVRTGTGATGNLTVTASVSAGHVVIAGAFKILVPPTADAWNKDDKSANVTLSASDKTATLTSTVSAGVRSTTTHPNGTAGKFYAEFFIVDRPNRFGIAPTSNTLTQTNNNFYILAVDGSIFVNGTNVGSVGSAFALASDVACVAWDAGAEKVWFRKNGGNWNNDASADPATGTNGLDCSFAASTEHALWMQGLTAADSVTLRTELAEYTQTVPAGFTSWMGETPAVTAKTITADAGSYALTGVEASLEKSRFVTADAGSYALTGAVATLTKGAAVIHYDLPAAAGSYALTGATAGLYRGREVLGVAGSYGLSGQTASLERGREVAGDAGSYALTGAAASLETGREVLALAGSYAVTGAITTLRHDWKTAAVSGSYSLTGADATITKGAAIVHRTLPAVAGSYALTGTAASLELGMEVVALAGSYVLSGAAASLEYGREVGAVPGSYTLTGTPANLLRVNAKAIIGLPGSYALTGATASLECGYEVLGIAGAYSLAGTAATLTKAGPPPATIFVGLTDGVTDGVLGAGGSLPTGWTVIVNTASSTLTVSGHGTDNSVEYFDLQSTGGGEVIIYFPSGDDGIASSAGATWQASAYLKAIASTVDSGALGTVGLWDAAAETGGNYNSAAIPASGAYQASLRSVTYKLEVSDPATIAATGVLDFQSEGAFTVRIAAKLELVSVGILALSGLYSLLGTLAAPKLARKVPALVSSYALTGTAASLYRGREVTGVAGSYALTGATASLERGRLVTAVAGSYALTGTVASLEYGREVAAVSGSYTLSGAAVTFRQARKLTGIGGSYALVGTPANLLRPGAFAIIGLPGVYALTGTATSLEYGREVVASAGSYALTGSSVTLIWSAEVPIAPGGQPDGDPVRRRAARKRRPQIFVIVVEAAKKLAEQRGPLRKKRKKLAKIIADEVLEEAGGLLAPDRLLLELAIRRELSAIPLTEMHTEGWQALQDALMQVITDAEQTAQRLRVESEEEDDLLLLLAS